MKGRIALLAFAIYFTGCSDPFDNTGSDADIDIDSDSISHSDTGNVRDADTDTDSGNISDSDFDADTDNDGDGYLAPDDCDDNNASVYPGASEICDGIDNNCDSNIDEGFDFDTDGFTSCGGDCDDSNADVHPGAVEYCNGKDNDCDGTIDNDCVCYCPAGGCICVPDTERYCDTPAYSRWGVQTCDENGLRWGSCDEVTIPPVCSHTDSWYSPAGVECCVENGLCCQDMWDYDSDGNSWDSVGGCNAISCE